MGHWGIPMNDRYYSWEGIASQLIQEIDPKGQPNWPAYEMKDLSFPGEGILQAPQAAPTAPAPQVDTGGQIGPEDLIRAATEPGGGKLAEELT